MQGMQEILLTLRTAKMIVERTPQVYRRVMEDIYFSSLALEVASPVHTIQYVRSSDICCLITQYKYYDEVTGDVQITTHMGTPAPHNRPWRLQMIDLMRAFPRLLEVRGYNCFVRQSIAMRIDRGITRIRSYTALRRYRRSSLKIERMYVQRECIIVFGVCA